MAMVSMEHIIRSVSNRSKLIGHIILIDSRDTDIDRS